MIGMYDGEFKSRVGYEPGDNRYDHVGRKTGRIQQAINECNNAKTLVAYMDRVARALEKDDQAVR